MAYLPQDGELFKRLDSCDIMQFIDNPMRSAQGLLRN